MAEKLKKACFPLDLSLDYDLSVWIRHEDDVKGEEFIDDLPESLIMHDTYFKKVYPKGVELKSPIYVKNYISNRVLENLAPMICKELNRLHLKVDQYDMVSFLKREIKELNDVFKFPDEIRWLRNKERKELTAFIFERFGYAAN